MNSDCNVTATVSDSGTFKMGNPEETTKKKGSMPPIDTVVDMPQQGRKGNPTQMCGNQKAVINTGEEILILKSFSLQAGLSFLEKKK